MRLRSPGGGVRTPASAEGSQRRDVAALITAASLIAGGALVVTGRIQFLTFHTAVEFLAAAVDVTIFAIAWHTRRLVDDDFLTVLGIGQAFVAVLTLVHLLAHPAMPTLAPDMRDLGLGSEAWLMAGGVQAGALIVAPFFVGRRMRHTAAVVAALGTPLVFGFAILAVRAVTSDLGAAQDVPYRLQREIVVSLGLVLGSWLMWRKRDRLGERVFRPLGIGLALMVAAEVSFGVYVSPFDLVSIVGHMLHLASVYFIYTALVARTLDDPFRVLFRRLALQDEMLREENRYAEGTNRVAAAIASSLEVEDILRASLREAATVARADAATMLEYRGGDRFALRLGHGEPLSHLSQSRMEGSIPHGKVVMLKAGQPLALRRSEVTLAGEAHVDAPDEPRSMLCIPLLSRAQLTGMMCLHWLDLPEVPESESLRRFAVRLGSLVSLALENAHLYEGEHRVAETLQNAMMAAVQNMPSIEVGSVYRSAPGVGRIGGDFFDVFELDRGRVGFVLGDVAGKGIEAAATSALARTTIRALAYRSADPGVVLAGANQALLRQLPSDEFVTAVFGVLEPIGGDVALGLAGHPEPVVCLRPELVPPDAIRNPPLGTVPLDSFGVWRFTIRPQDAVVVFSDGIVEARRLQELFGMERIREVLLPCTDPCQTIVDRLMDAAESYAGGEVRDDIAVLALRPHSPSQVPS